MLSTEDFYAAAARAGMTRSAIWHTPTGDTVMALVRFRAPARDVLGGEQSSVDYTIHYPASELVGLKRNDRINIAGTGEFIVNEDPVSRLDGSEREATLAKV